MSASPGERATATLVKRCEVIEAALETALRDVRALKHTLAGRNPVFDAMKLFNELWCARWAPGDPDAKYAFAKKDGADLKRLFNLDPRPDALKQRIVRFFADTEVFVVKNRHPFNIFVSKFNAYGSAVDAPTQVMPQRGVADCRHEPRCTTEIQHTQRRKADLRAR